MTNEWGFVDVWIAMTFTSPVKYAYKCKSVSQKMLKWLTYKLSPRDGNKGFKNVGHERIPHESKFIFSVKKL